MPKSVPRASAATPDDTAEAVVRVAMVQSTCLALIDAAAHLRRTSILVEAASTAALTRALRSPAGETGWVQALEGAERMMASASEAFERSIRTAALVAAAPAEPPTAP
jgi:hypothetical protein